MPCRVDDYPDSSDGALIEYAKLKALIEEIKTEKLPKYYGSKEWTIEQEVYFVRSYDLDKLTQQLCTYLTEKSSEEISNYSKELQEWWQKHKTFDIQRLQTETGMLKKSIEIGEQQIQEKKNELQLKLNQLNKLLNQ